MSAIANNSNISDTSPRVTSISTNARIEYIMRFSQHAVLVVDNDSDNYSSISNQFIGSLADNYNAAFISLSPKLNDIQIRCRLVEQLFSDTLFDPEEPLAVTVLKLASDKKEPISIVIEHAHFLSLQLLHEFCQLADIAAKGERCVNVLLLGEEKTGRLINENTVVFDNKLSILNAADGQLIPNDSTIFAPDKAPIMFTPARKFVLGMTAFAIICSALVLTFYQNDTFTFTQIESSTVPNIKPDIVNEETSFNEEVINRAAPNDVLTALSMNNQPLTEQRTIAKPDEIMAVLVSVRDETITQNITLEIDAAVNNPSVIHTETDIEVSALANETNVSSPQNIVESTKDEALVIDNSTDIFAEEITFSDNIEVAVLQHAITSQYYAGFSKGFVVQIVGFSSRESYTAFMDKYILENFTAYHRLLNGKKFFVVTTKVYPLRSDAMAAASLLPEELKLQGTWIKSIRAVNIEINDFNNAQ